jgi:photosystem II stability/assembly factor-like uncharacterized protein
MGAIAVDPVTPTTLYAETEDSIERIYKSVDGGTTWQPTGEGLLGQTINALAVDPYDDLVVYVGTTHGMYRSEDAGATWHPLEGFPDVDIHAVVLPASRPGTVYVAASGTYEEPSVGGVFASVDGGTTWRRSIAGMTDWDVISLGVDSTSGQLRFVGTDASGAYVSA